MPKVLKTGLMRQKGILIFKLVSLLGFSFTCTLAADFALKEEIRKQEHLYYQRRKQEQNSVLNGIIDIDKKRDSIFYKANIIFQSEGIKTARGQIAALIITRQLLSIYESYLHFATNVRKKAASSCLIDKSIEDIVGYNLHLLEDMHHNPHAYDLFQTTFEEIYEIRSFFKSFPRLKGVKKP